MKKIWVAALLILTAVLSACGSAGTAETVKETEAPATERVEDTEEVTTEEVPAEIDPTKPSIIIEAGDYDGILELGSKMQSFEVSPGTVIKITGIYEKLGSTASVMEANETGDSKRGISLYFDYEQENLPDDTVIEVTGVAVTGDYFMEFHVSDGFLKVLD